VLKGLLGADRLQELMGAFAGTGESITKSVERLKAEHDLMERGLPVTAGRQEGEMTMTYTHFTDVTKEPQPPDNGILSRTRFNDDRLKVVRFGFAQSEELSEHTASARRPPYSPGGRNPDAR
jgi:hypothetical protein